MFILCDELTKCAKSVTDVIMNRELVVFFLVIKLVHKQHDFTVKKVTCVQMKYKQKDYWWAANGTTITSKMQYCVEFSDMEWLARLHNIDQGYATSWEYKIYYG